MAATIDVTPARWPRTGPAGGGRPAHHGSLVAEPLGGDGAAIPGAGDRLGAPEWPRPRGDPLASAAPTVVGSRRAAHRRATLAARNRGWAPQREPCRPMRAAAALDMAAAQAGLSVGARLDGL
jgi:hypothetical protein